LKAAELGGEGRGEGRGGWGVQVRVDAEESGRLEAGQCGF